MSALINHKIEKNAFELVGDKIGAILFTELENQATNYEPLADVDAVLRERTNPISQVETSLVNVSLQDVPFDNKNYGGSVEGQAVYNIDVYVKVKTKPGLPGDQEAQYKGQRLLGIIRAILEDPQYKTLGFTPGFIGGVMVTALGMKEADPDDGANCAMGRLQFTVRATETTELLESIALESTITNVKLGITDNGYKYEYGAEGPNIPVDTRYVTIYNEDTNEIIALLSGGDRYGVQQLQDIIDTIFNNTNNIIDPITE